MNTKILGLPKTKEVGLEYAKKNLRSCERWLAEPPGGGGGGKENMDKKGGGGGPADFDFFFL